MDRKYDPEHLLMKLALHYEAEGKNYLGGDPEDLKNTYIQIANKNPDAPPFRIIKDSNRPDSAVILLSGNCLMSQDGLEIEKDNLGKVTVSYKGRTPVNVDTFQKFLKWLGIK